MVLDFIIAVGAQLTAKAVEHTFVAVRQICRYTRNVENLRSKIDELGKTKDELQGRVDQATQDGDVIKEEVLKYITDADCLSREAQTFLRTDCERAVIKCFGGSLPNLVSRRRLSKQAKEKADELLRAIQAAPRDGFLVVPSRPALHSCIADRGGYADFETREKILEEIMAALSNSEVRKVGVYGMGGVGKTMLAKEVARRATEKKLFSEVVFSTVSHTMDLKAIQQDVAGKIDLQFGATDLSVAGRADRLKRRLTEERKILIILDDIWDSLDLVQVGLNFDHDQKGCKILMTSRSLEVTRNSMGAEINIKVGHLSDVEARNLFTTIVGTNVVERQDFKSLTNAVVGECRGLPLAIMTVASALKDNDELSDWKDALFQLQNSDPTNIPGMLKDVYPSIRLSFDYLESEEAKNLLLLCSLYGEDVDIEVDELMMLIFGRGLLQNVHIVAAARRRVDSLVHRLKDRCLLLDGFNCDRVKMHDVIRDVAIAIASEDSWGMHRFMIDDTLEDRLSEKSFKETKALSLLGNSDSIQPPKRELECPQLELFLISRRGFYGHNYLQIPIVDFLNESTHLKVLSLYGAHFLIKLPTSLKFLQNLRTLRLNKCKLDDIDYIGDLINLRVLDLRSSTFQQLPSNIGELTRLQLLNLEGCKDLKVISENVISSLMGLEELYMPANFRNWDAGKVATNRRNANVAELMNLQKLTTLFLSIPDAKILPKGFVFSEKLERYRIGIGIEYDKFDGKGLSRSLVLRDCEESLLMAHGLEALMRSSEGLKLGGLAEGMIKNNAVYDPDKDGFPKLKILKLSDCDVAQDVVDALEQKSTIHPSKLTTDSFKQLREVKVSNCGRLKNLFPLSIAKRLNKIKVIDCKSVEEIVEHDDQLREDEAAFDELLSLHLQSLPKLVQFICWPQLGVTTASSSVESAIYPLFSEKVALPKLGTLDLSGIHVKKLWADQLPSTSIHMQNLSEMYVKKCNELEYLSSVDVAKSLVKLQEVKIEECRNLELIFLVTKKQGGEEDGTLLSEKLSLPQLQTLHLSDLPNLKMLCATVDKKNAQLGEQEPLFNGMVAFPKLESLTLSKIVVNVKYLSSFCVAKSLVSLEIEYCTSLEVIFLVSKKQGGDEDGTLSPEKISLPQLKTLRISGLPNLKTLCATVDKEIMQRGEQEPFVNGMIGLSGLHALSLFELNIERLWPDFDGKLLATTSYMENLTSLTVSKCNKLKYLISFAMAERLVKLKKLNVTECSEMECIVVVRKRLDGEDQRSSKQILFPRLTSIWLGSLSGLKSFCQGADDCIQLPALLHLEINVCPKLKTFVDKQGENELATKSFFHEKIELSGLHALSLFELNIERLWPDFDRKLLATTSYMENLTSLTVSKCNKLKYLISFAMAERLVELKELHVAGCSEMECIVVVRKRLDGEDQRSSKQILFPKLTRIRLVDLSGLKSFCQGADFCIQLPALLNLQIIGCPELKTFVDKQGENELATKSFFHEKMIIFPRLESLDLWGINITKLWEDHRHSVLTCMPNLKELEVIDCDNLKHLFSSTVCTSPFPLERLWIRSCKGMEEVVAITEEPRSKAMSALSVSLLFSKLEFLFLYDLPKLKQFCKGDIVEFPLLSELRIRECSELRAFIVDSTANEKQLEEMDKQPLFSHKVVFPCLRHVETDWKEDIDEIFGLSQFPSKEIKQLHVRCPTHDEPISLSILEILRRYPNLETLELSGSFVNIKTCQRDDQDEPIPTQSLARPLMPFHNLSELQVSECHELTYLLDSSVARSLAQLKALSIRSCGKMRDIIRDCEEGETTEDEAFDFKRLEILVLYDLPTLKSFYSGNNAMMFPKLRKLILSQCPEMKSFSRGIMTASLLVTIITEIKHESWMWKNINILKEWAVPIKECWNGDVNTTIRKLWEESSNSSSQQPSAVTVVEDCSGEGTSTKGAGMKTLLIPCEDVHS